MPPGGGGFLDLLKQGVETFNDFKREQLDRDLLKRYANVLLTQGTVTTTSPDVQGDLKADPLGDTLKDTFSNTTNLVLLGVAVLLGAALVTLAK